MLATLLARCLDDFTLAVCRLDIESVADGVQRDDRSGWSVFGKPGVLACARQARHKCYRAAKIFMWHVMQTAELVAVEKKSCVLIHERVRAGETSTQIGRASCRERV